MFTSEKSAYEFLKTIKAPEHLTMHVKLVREAGDRLIETCEELDLELDFEFIRMGIILHDIGKVVHPDEMSGPGSKHELEGEQLLLKWGAPTALARVCVSHARWKEMPCSTEELLIALSDKLWKGKRVADLELQVIDRIAHLLKVKRWDIFSSLDLVFEDISAKGYERLQRSTSKQHQAN